MSLARRGVWAFTAPLRGWMALPRPRPSTSTVTTALEEPVFMTLTRPSAQARHRTREVYGMLLPVDLNTGAFDAAGAVHIPGPDVLLRMMPRYFSARRELELVRAAELAVEIASSTNTVQERSIKAMINSSSPLEYQCESVKRKRRAKMNKHKLRKRRRAMRHKADK